MALQIFYFAWAGYSDWSPAPAQCPQVAALLAMTPQQLSDTPI